MSEGLKTESSFCATQIGANPKVLGWRLLIKAPEVPERVGSIIMTDDFKKNQERRQNIGLVLKVGPAAFTGRFEELRCSEGDWIHYSILEREPVYPNGHNCYYINDDRIYSILKPEEVAMFLNEKK